MILVAGGAGFIGSHVNKMLSRAGYSTLVLDNLSNGCRESVRQGVFVKGDLADLEGLHSLFARYPIQAVMHFAAFTHVGESVNDPARYYFNNVFCTLNLLTAMVRAKVKTLVFSSTAAVFGHPLDSFIAENHPCAPINPYGETKWIVEKMLRDFETAHGLKFCCLRYFNAAGGDPEGEIKHRQRQAHHLIPRILSSVESAQFPLTIHGTDYPTPDGTCIRDYIHIEDLGEAHLGALKRLLEGAPSSHYNLGSGRGFSVREVVAEVEKVLGRKVETLEGPRRPGDPAILRANPAKAARELGWHPRYSLADMIEHARTFPVSPQMAF